MSGYIMQQVHNFMIAHQVGVAEKNTCQFHIESYHKDRSAESAMREESSRLGGNFPHDIYTKLTLTPTSMPTLNMKPNTDPNPDPNFNTKRNPDHDIDPDTELDQKPNHNYKPNLNPTLSLTLNLPLSLTLTLTLTLNLPLSLTLTLTLPWPWAAAWKDFWRTSAQPLMLWTSFPCSRSQLWFSLVILCLSLLSFFSL